MGSLDTELRFRCIKNDQHDDLTGHVICVLECFGIRGELNTTH